MSLYLRYRLWVAEMNFDINVLRIFNDYLNEITTKKDEPEVKTGIDYFGNSLLVWGQQSMNWGNGMHLLKMKLVAYSRESKQVDAKTYEAGKHKDLKKCYFKAHEQG